jgi:hypothetical protein
MGYVRLAMYESIWSLPRVSPLTDLLDDLPLFKYVLQCDVELAQVVLTEPIMIPADTFQERYPHHGHLEGHVPFRV